MTEHIGRMSKTDVDVLRRELIGLFEHIQRIRKEIAAIRRPGANEDEDHFSQMSDELDAIVAATEAATDTIMENVEQMDDIITAVRPHVTDPEALRQLATFPDKTGAVFEACAFQDITGQRITKVVKSLQFIEQRVNALIDIWGPETLAGVEVEDNTPRDEYGKYLHGPQLAGKGISQADVDAMLGGGSASSPKPASPPAPAAAKPAAPKPAAAKPASPPAKPAAAAPKPAAPAPKPAAPKPAPKTEEDSDLPKLGQDDIDKLFG